MSATPSTARSRPRPRGTLNQARWEEVLQVASAVFAEKGYLAATLGEIASRLGILKGSLYYYIDSKEDLLFEILYRVHEEGLAFIQEDPATARWDPPARIAAFIRRWMEGLAQPSPLDVIDEFDHRYLGRERRMEILALRRRIAKATEDIIAEGVRDGSFHPAVDPSTAASTLLRSVNTTSRWFKPRDGATWQEVIDWMVGLYLAGLAHGPSSLGREAEHAPTVPRYAEAASKAS